MHQRSAASRTRHWLSGFLSLLLVSGCLPTPTKAPTGARPMAIAGKPVAASPSATPSEAPLGTNTVPTLPIEVQAPIISHNGGNVIQGTVMAPANIISHNGGNIISHNGGNIVGNNGGNIISHNGGNLKISQVPLAYTTVRLKDAAGNPVKDAQGNELVTKTDENGNYKFPVDVKGRNLVVHAEVPGQKADLVALLPKEGVTAETPVAVDMASTLTLSYILELYVKGDLATFEKLPKDLESKARVQTEEAIVKGAIALPETLEREKLISTVSSVLDTDQAVGRTFEEIRRLLVVAGLRDEGDGLPATDIPVSTVDGVVSDANGNQYVFSRSRHSVWWIGPDGIAHTLVAQGKWGYPDQLNDKVGDFRISGMCLDHDGTILLADTNYHRIVRIGMNGRVTTVAGTGLPGFSGDKGDAKDALLNGPTGLTVATDGSILFCDSGNNSIRRINISGEIDTLVGSAGSSGLDGERSPFEQPQGLHLSKNGELFVADYGNNSIKKVINGKVSAVEGLQATLGPTSFANVRGNLYVMCLTSKELIDISGPSQNIDTKEVRNGDVSVFYFWNPKIVSSFQDGLVFNNAGRLYFTSDLRSLKHIFGAVFSASSMNGQLSLAMDLEIINNEVLIVDLARHMLVRVAPDGTIAPYLGNGTSDHYLPNIIDPLREPLPFPVSISKTRDGGLLISSIGTFPVVRKVRSSGEALTVVGNGEINYTSVPSGKALAVALTNPYDAIELPSGELLISEPEQNRLLIVDKDGNISSLFSSGDDLKYPYSFVLDSFGRLNYIELRGDRIVVLDNFERKTRLRYSQLEPEVPAGTEIRSVAFAPDSSIYVATRKRVVKVSVEGKKTVIAGDGGQILNGTSKDDGLSQIEKIALSESGDLYVLEQNHLKKIPAHFLREF